MCNFTHSFTRGNCKKKICLMGMCACLESRRRTHQKNSCLAPWRVMSHIWMSHMGTCAVFESCHTYEWVMGRIFFWELCHISHENEWGMSHIYITWMRHVTFRCVTLQVISVISHITYEWVMSHITCHIYVWKSRGSRSRFGQHLQVFNESLYMSYQ